MNNIIYTSDVTSITAKQLTGFFVGWPTPPSPETLRQLLHKSDCRVLAIDEDENAVVGFITALTDGVLFGYISSLEVRPAHQNLGIGKQLVTRMLAELDHLYAIDLVCDPDIQPFYERCGLRPCSAMIVRRRDSLNPG
ncbi:MAG: GNAT family N-acetyltransferase [Capsulimonas sp.]|uniref:GNAT family N-acetyltransferase n=1 Tax=Capsulimonas sp. TaxID=2494211 RepID=UPI0032651B10